MFKSLIMSLIVGFSSVAYSAQPLEKIVSIQQAKQQGQAKTLQDLQNEIAVLKKSLQTFQTDFLSKVDAEKTYAKPGRSVGINLTNCTEDYNFSDIGTEHRLSSYQCSAGKVSIGVRHYGAANRVDRVYCCSLSGSIQ